MIELSGKLNAALIEQQQATKAHAQAALAAEDGTRSSATALDKATKELQQADKRVNELRAAIAAAEEGEEARIAAEEAAAQRAHAAALNESLKEFRAAGSKWDAAMDALVAATGDYLQAFRRLQSKEPTPEMYRRIESARTHAPEIIRFRLREYFDDAGALALSPEAQHLSKLVNHLPEPQE